MLQFLLYFDQINAALVSRKIIKSSTHINPITLTTGGAELFKL